MRERHLKLKNIFLCLSLTLLLVTVIIIIIEYNSKPLEKCINTISNLDPSVILDAGHGGIDSGAVSKNGTQEAGINLMVAEKTRDFMCFLGINSLLTRINDNSLNYDPDKTIRDNKNADLKERLNISKNNPNCDFLSIHLNKFEQSKYSGAQVFYSPNDNMSFNLAESLQKSLIDYLDSGNTRKAKNSPESVYLMKNISVPAVIIECGFLSNEEEEKKLKSDAYQTHIAIAITKGYIDYIKE